MADGADALDVGAASSNPRSKHVPADVEIARLKPIVGAAKKNAWKISVDSFATETQIWGLKAGADYLNDIQGFADESFYPELAAAKKLAKSP